MPENGAESQWSGVGFDRRVNICGKLLVRPHGARERNIDLSLARSRLLNKPNVVTIGVPYTGNQSSLTAFFKSTPIFASLATVNSFSVKAVGHMAPSSRFAWSLKPKVAYLDLNFCALWKKQTTLPSFAYAGIPYQVFGESAAARASPRTAGLKYGERY